MVVEMVSVNVKPKECGVACVPDGVGGSSTFVVAEHMVYHHKAVLIKELLDSLQRLFLLLGIVYRERGVSQ
jgi:hypothetical protein